MKKAERAAPRSKFTGRGVRGTLRGQPDQTLVGVVSRTIRSRDAKGDGLAGGHWLGSGVAPKVIDWCGRTVIRDFAAAEIDVDADDAKVVGRADRDDAARLAGELREID